MTRIESFGVNNGFQSNRRRSVLWICVRAVILLTLIWIPSRASAQTDSVPATEKFSGKTMGPIEYHVVLSNLDRRIDREQIAAAIEQRLEEINQLMSTYKNDSDVTKFNRSRSTDWQDVDSETVRVVERAIEISRLTGGAFDITVGPAVNAWQFGPAKNRSFTIPTDEQIANIQSSIGFEYLETRLDPPALRKTTAATEIDLSAIAKGYAVDEVAKTLDQFGLTNYMVEVGGEVFASGQRDGGGPWRIGIESPKEFFREIGNVAELDGMAMATSGDYRNFEEVDGKRYSHTIDPQTCRPVEHSLASACVVASDCMTADAIATAVMVLGAERGAALCRENSIELFTVARDADFGPQLTESATPEFPFFETPSDNASVARQPEDPAGNQSTSIWPTFLGAAIVLSLAILGMAVGAIFGNKPVQGSCGGLSSMTNEDGDANCTVCAKPTTDCVER